MADTLSEILAQNAAARAGGAQGGRGATPTATAVGSAQSTERPPAPQPEDGERNLESLIRGDQPGEQATEITRLGNPFDVLVGGVRGGVQAANETVDLAAQLGGAAGGAAVDVGALDFLDPTQQNIGGDVGRALVGFADFVHRSGFITEDGDVGADIPAPAQSDAALGRVSEAVAQTVVGFYAGGRVLKGLGAGAGVTTAGKVTRGFGAGAIGDFAVFDGNDERLSNLVEMVPALRNPITGFLAATEDDPELVGRMRNVLEGAGIGGAFEGLLAALRGTKALRAGDVDGVKAAAADVERAVRVEAQPRAEGTEAFERVPEGQGADTAEGGYLRGLTFGEFAQATFSRTWRQGQGTGTNLYRSTIDEMHAAGRIWASDSDVSAPAARIYDKLADEGYVVIKNELGEEAPDYAPTYFVLPKGSEPRSYAELAAEFKAAEDAARGRPSGSPVTDAPAAETTAPGAVDGSERSLSAPRSSQGDTPNIPEIPEGVMSSRTDAQAFLDEALGLRPRTGELDIKPPTEGMDDAAAAVAREEVARHGEWTISTLNSPQTLDATLRALVNTTEKTTRSDPELQSLVKFSADELGQDPEIMLAAAARITGAAQNVDVAVQTMRTMWRRLGQTVDAHVGKDLASVSNEEFANVLRDIHNAMTFANMMNTVKSAMGRGLRVFQLPDADTYVRAVMEGDPENILSAGHKGMPSLPKTPDEAMDWLQAWGYTSTNPKGRADLLEGLNALPGAGKYARQSLANLFTANILSGIPSVMLNISGPAMVGAIRTLEKTSGAAIASFNPLLTGAERAALRSTARRVPQAYIQAMGDAADVFKFAWQAAREGRSIIGGGGAVYDTATNFGPVSQGAIRAARRGEPQKGYFGDVTRLLGSTTLGDATYAFGNAANFWPRFFSHINNGLDEASKRFAYHGETRAEALVEGAVKHGLSGDELQAFVTDTLRSSMDELGHAADKRLLESAERTTLTGTPGSGKLTRGITGWVNMARKEMPEMRYILPIFNVPANALGETMRRVPVVNFLFKDHLDELMGNRGAVAQGEAYGRTMLGAAFLTWGFMAARSGMLTGKGPENPDDYKVWRQTHEPFSMRIGDQWLNYSRYDIVGALIGIPAVMFDASVHRRQDESWGELTFAAVTASAEYFRERAALQTVTDVLALGQSKADSGQTLERLMGSVAGRMVVPNFVTQLGRNLNDDLVRQKSNVVDRIMDLIPGQSTKLDPMRNILGEPIHKPQNALYENLVPITLAPAVEYEDDAVLDEIGRLYEVTGYAPGVIDQGDISGGFYDAREVQLEDGRSLYDAIIRQRLDLRIDGLTLRQSLDQLFNGPEYAEAIDASASVLEGSTGEISRGYLVRRVFTDYNRAAKEEVARNSEIGARYLALTKAKERDNGRLGPYRADQLGEDPDIHGFMRDLGIDFEGYLMQVRGE